MILGFHVYCSNGKDLIRDSTMVASQMFPEQVLRSLGLQFDGILKGAQ